MSEKNWEYYGGRGNQTVPELGTYVVKRTFEKKFDNIIDAMAYYNGIQDDSDTEKALWWMEAHDLVECHTSIQPT